MALSDLFAPAWIFGNQQSMDAVNAWNAAHLKTRPKQGPYTTPTSPASPADAQRNAIVDAMLGRGVIPEPTGFGAEMSMGDIGTTPAGPSPSAPGQSNAPNDAPISNGIPSGETPAQAGQPSNSNQDTPMPGLGPFGATERSNSSSWGLDPNTAPPAPDQAPAPAPAAPVAAPAAPAAPGSPFGGPATNLAGLGVNQTGFTADPINTNLAVQTAMNPALDARGAAPPGQPGAMGTPLGPAGFPSPADQSPNPGPPDQAPQATNTGPDLGAVPGGENAAQGSGYTGGGYGTPGGENAAQGLGYSGGSPTAGTVESSPGNQSTGGYDLSGAPDDGGNTGTGLGAASTGNAGGDTAY